jgi:hypothetical protein
MANMDNNQASQTSKANTDPVEAEVSISSQLKTSTSLKFFLIRGQRTRLRRNQRNSRARKQAYVQDLEQRWRKCVELGA